MGKSIIHCATCGNAIREDDFAHGKASTIDSRSYCSNCRAVSSAPHSDVPKSSSRIPLSTSTRKIPVVKAEEESRLPLWVGGGLIVVALIGLLGFALSGGRAKPAEPPPPREAVVKPKPVPPPQAPEKKPEMEPPKPAPEPKAAPAPKPEIRPEPKPEEKTPPPAPPPPEADVAKAPPVEPAPKPEAEPAPAPAVPSKDKPAPAPAPKKELPQVDQKKVDQAIKKGTAWLVSQSGKLPKANETQPTKICGHEELVLWTLIHAGVSESTTVFKFLFKNITEGELRRTYEVAVQAMILEELDRVRYQERIQQCAQYLADNQCPNGQWFYGEVGASIPLGPLPVVTGVKKSATGVRQKPPVARRLKVTPRKTGPAEGDNSNAQYAALGIRACVDAGIDFPDETYQRARKWWRGAQHAAPAGTPGVATGGEPSAPPAGWCYMMKDHGHRAYGSMTAGAVGALAIYDTILGEDWRKDRAVASGLSWIAKNFGVDGNPGPPSEAWCKDNPRYGHYYFLYALERAGVLCKTEWVGTHPWYSEGATFLLSAQDKDGSWDASVQNTCFAILFLKRATRPLEDVASMDDKRK